MPKTSAHKEAGEADVLALAKAFRAALEMVDEGTWRNATIRDFPRGACGHVSEMLGRFLRERLGIEAEYVLRDFHDESGNWIGGHAHLLWNGITVDVTGDQFGWPPVIVERDPPWHARGEVSLQQPLTNDEGWWKRVCGHLYAATLEQLRHLEASDRAH